MTKTNAPLLDAAQAAFVRYGFKRTTMGDIAQATGMSRQTLYARYANKDEVYAAVLEHYVGQMITDLKDRWTTDVALDEAMDIYADLTMFPLFDMLQSHPDSRDLIEGAKTPVGQAAIERAKGSKKDLIATLLTPHAAALEANGLTPAQLADFIETTKEAIVSSARDRDHLSSQFATLKASVLRLAVHP